MYIGNDRARTEKLFNILIFLAIDTIFDISPAKCCKLQPDFWMNTTIPGSEYYISRHALTFEDCQQYCRVICNNSKLASVRVNGVTPLITNEFQRTTCTSKVKLWISNLDARSECHVLFGDRIERQSSCEAKFQCFCHRHATEKYCGREVESIGYLNFYKNYQAMPYYKAEGYCENMWNSSLIHYNDPLQYINLSKNLSLGHGSYWIKRFNIVAQMDCLVLNVSQSSTFISRANCSKYIYSVCSRLGNITSVIDDTDFVEMIQNMTVDYKQTRKHRLKLKSADDNRIISRVIGGLIGIIVLVSVICLIIASDIQTLFKKNS